MKTSAEDHARTLETAAQNAALAAQAGKQAIQPQHRDDPFYRFDRPARAVAPSAHREIYPRLPDAVSAAKAATAVTATFHPFRVEPVAAGKGQIKTTTPSWLHKSYQADDTLAISGLNTAFDLAEGTCAWIEIVMYSGGGVVSASFKQGTAFPPIVEWDETTSSIQTKYNLPVGMVVSDSSMQAPGFAISGSLRWHQLLREHQIMLARCFGNGAGFAASPWQGAVYTS